MAAAGHQATVARLREHVATILEVDVAEVTEDALFYEDLEIDSLHRTEIVAWLEQEFRVRIDPEEWAAVRTINDVVDLLRARRALD